MKPAHLQIIGDTQCGKTFVSNRIHRAWPGVSVFVNTNEVRDIYGYPIGHTSQLKAAMLQSRHVVYTPPDGSTNKELTQYLEEIRVELFRLGKGWHTQWCNLTIDEIHEYGHSKLDPVTTIATRGLGAYGIRMVGITQYPVGMSPGVRTNMKKRLVFEPGAEGEDFLRQKTVDNLDLMMKWVEQPYHFAYYEGKKLRALCTPVA